MQQWLNQYKDVGVLILRIFIGIRLIYGVIDNIFSNHHMIRFRDFLEQFHFPFPMISAIVSVYLQFFAGLIILVGWKIRIAAVLMILNFFIALIMVHRHDSFEAMTPPLAILFCNILFLFQGAGYYSIDRVIAGNKKII